MIWTHAGRLHWVSHDLDGVDGQIRVINGISYWEVIDTEDGCILYSGQCSQTLDAMRLCASYIEALKDIREALPDLEKALENLDGIKTETSNCASKEEKTEVFSENQSNY